MNINGYAAGLSGVHDPAPQQGGTWHENRIGKLTASRLNDMLDKRASKNSDGNYDGAKRTALKYSILCERMTNIVAPGPYVSEAMLHGTETEPLAVDAYAQTLPDQSIIKTCGFFDHPTIDNLGASPDRLVGTKGLGEFKCPATATHLRYLQSVECPPDYWPQMTLQLACTGREWCDFVTFDPRIKNKALRMKIWRFIPGEEYAGWLISQCVDFLAEIDAMFDQLGDSNE